MNTHFPGAIRGFLSSKLSLQDIVANTKDTAVPTHLNVSLGPLGRRDLTRLYTRRAVVTGNAVGFVHCRFIE